MKTDDELNFDLLLKMTNFLIKKDLVNEFTIYLIEQKLKELKNEKKGN